MRAFLTTAYPSSVAAIKVDKKGQSVDETHQSHVDQLVGYDKKFNSLPHTLLIRCRVEVVGNFDNSNGQN
jgi:hypothetical protein